MPHDSSLVVRPEERRKVPRVAMSTRDCGAHSALDANRRLLAPHLGPNEAQQVVWQVRTRTYLSERGVARRGTGPGADTQAEDTRRNSRPGTERQGSEDITGTEEGGHGGGHEK